jgi:hypothetical protein
MILNILLALLLIWISRQYAEKMKPGAIFSFWLVFAGLARSFIEFFRPDQPHFGNSFVSYSMFVSLLMAVTGVVMLLVRFGKLQLAFAADWEEDYRIKPVEKPARTRSRPMAEDVSTLDEYDAEDEEEDEEVIPAPVKKKPAVKAKAKAPAKKESVKKPVAAKKPAAKRKTSE